MQYRYRVLGKVEHSFILRGAYFTIGSEIDFYIDESELPFVKERCKLETIEDLQKATNAENSISGVAKTTTKSKGQATENVQPVVEKPVKRQGRTKTRANTVND